MKIKEINNKEAWEGFLFGCDEKTFLNSWNWGEFQKKLGHKIWRLGILNDNESVRGLTPHTLVAVALVVRVKAKRGTFLFVPHGPNIKVQNSKCKAQNDNLKFKINILNSLLDKLKEIAKEEKASFIRFSPIWERNEENKKVFESLGFREAPIHIHPEVTWVLDVTSPEEEILMNMRKNTRYEIRKGLKINRLEIVRSEKEKDIEIFNTLYKKTAGRHDFVPFSFDYLKKEYESFSRDKAILTLHAKYKGELLSSAIIVFWQKMAFYHHGASILKYPKIPSSHLLQWEAIKTAKKRGCELYNFWGVADVSEEELKKKKHPWAGLSIFKRGFGGHKKEYVKTQDLVLSQKYWLNYIVETVRRHRRHY